MLSHPEAVIEHLVGCQGLPREAQVHAMQCNAMQLCDRKGWSQDPPLPSSHLRAGSGGESICLEISVFLRPFEGKYLFIYLFAFTAVVVFGLVCICCSH